MKISQPTEHIKNRPQYPKTFVDAKGAFIELINNPGPAAGDELAQQLFHYQRYGRPGRMFARYVSAECSAWRRRR